MKYLDDSHYIDRVLGGDSSAFAGLVAKHKNMVFSIALKILQNREDAEEQKLLINKALKRIPEEDNLLITLFYKAENSIEEISSITRLTESNVKVRLHRIRKRLYGEISEILKYQVAV